MTDPSRTPQKTQPIFGFNRFNEKLNARVAMLGFVGAIILEIVTGKGLLTWLGLH